MLKHLICCGLALSLLAVGCNRDSEAPPIAPEEMAEILKQIHLADGWVDQGGGSMERRRGMREDLYDEVLDKYGYEKRAFYASYRYYTDHPVMLDSIYASIIRDMEQRLEVERIDNLARLRKDNKDSTDVAAPDVRPDSASQPRSKPTPSSP